MAVKMHFFAAVFILVIQLVDQSTSIQCYRATSPNSTFPANRIQSSADSVGCTKVFRIAKTIDPNGDTLDESYEWDFFQSDPLTNLYVKCDETFEISSSGFNEFGKTILSYERRCLCCGDLCNDETMDSVCNGGPIFDKQCYAASGTNDQLLPNNSALVGCTPRQSCYKRSLSGESGGVKSATYEWGCATVPQEQCGGWVNATAFGTYYKGCACCGTQCNGRSMDEINADESTGCLVADTTTTAHTPVTFVPPRTTTIGPITIKPTGSTTPAIIYVYGGGFDGGSFVGGIFLGIAIVVGVMIGWYYYNRKHRHDYGDI